MLTLGAGSTAVVGQYPLTITGTYGSQTATTSLTLGVHVPTFNLTASNTTLGQGTSATTNVSISPQYGFIGGVTLAATGLPSGVTAAFTPNPSTSYNTLTFTATSAAPIGQYTVTVTGTSGTKVVSTTFTLGVFKPTFTLSGSSPINLGQGTTSSTYLSVNPQYGFNGSVALSISGLPAGVTGVFSPNPTTGYATLTLTASSTAALGQYAATVTGTSAGQTVTTPLTIGVFTPTFSFPSLGTVSLGQGGSNSTYISIYGQYGFNSNVTLAVTGLPSGVTASFSPNPASSGSSSLTLTATSAAPLGQYTLTVTGTAGSQTVSTPLTLGIYAPAFTLSTGSLVNVGQGTSGTGYVYVYGQYGFNSNVTLSVAGLPSGMTASFSTNPTSFNSAILITASGTVPVGAYTLTVTGTSGASTAATTLTVNVSAPSFVLYGSFGNLSLNQGSTGTATFFLSDQYGFNNPVTLSASGLPSGVTAAFSPNPTSASSTLTLTASGTATPGQATVTVTGVSGTASSVISLPITVNASGFALGDAPGQISLAAGSSATSFISVLPQNGFAGPVSLTLTGLPAGVTGNFSSNSISTSGMLTLTASASASVGSATATITGTSGSLTATTPLKVILSTAPTATTTVLAITASGAPATTVTSQTPVTLTAKISAGSLPLTTGQVAFCDVPAATACDSNHALGTAQIIGTGVAAYTFIPGPGTHTYKASFAGITGQEPSTSSSATLSVSAAQTSTTTLAQSGSAGNYTLTAVVTGQGSAAPSGSVAFLDTTSGNDSVGTATLASAPSTLTYPSTQTTGTSAAPTAVAIADFNGDGKPDVAYIAQYSNTVGILLGDGDGSFAAINGTLATGSQPTAMLAADFNGDGKMDLAIADTGSNSVNIFLGNGDGSFTPSALSPQTGSYPRAMVVGDFNDDGKLDLAVANGSSSSVTVLLGNGDGSFTASPLSSQTGASPTAITVADYNGDGIADLAVANSSSNTVSILLGNGDGSFSAAANVAVENNPSVLVGGDFNGDGKPDLAVASSGIGNVTILLGNGDGSFSSSSLTVPQFYSPTSLTVADLNGDGKQDLVMTGYGQTATLLGSGDGTFTVGPSITTISGISSTLVSDLNGDGVPDLFSANTSASNVVVFPGSLAQVSHASAGGINPVGTGLHAIRAAYAGDTAWKVSTSSTTQLTAQLATPTVTLTPSAASISSTQTLAVAIAVTGPGGAPMATGSIILSGGSYSSPATPLGTRSVTITVPAGSFSTGTAALTATYTPDIPGATAYKPASGSATISVTAPVRTTPTVTLTPSAARITSIQGLTVTVAVSSSPVPTGSVTLAGGGYSAQQTLANGISIFTLAGGALPVGADTLKATYTPDPASLPLYTAAAQSAAVTVSPALGTAAAVLTVTVSSKLITDTQDLSVTATIAGSATQAAPTGVVTLNAGTYSAQQTLANGSVTFLLKGGVLATGQYTLTAAYAGDPAYAPTNATTSVTVSPLLITASVPASVAAGAVANSTLTLTAGSYAGNLNLSCLLTSSPAGAQNLPTCKVSPVTVQISSGGNGISALSLSTTTATTALLKPPFPWKTLGLGAPIFASLLILILPARRRRLPILTLLLSVLGMAFIGCGTGNSSPGKTTAPVGTATPATTSGQYTFTVTATDATNSNITTSTSVTLTVQ